MSLKKIKQPSIKSGLNNEGFQNPSDNGEKFTIWLRAKYDDWKTKNPGQKPTINQYGECKAGIELKDIFVPELQPNAHQKKILEMSSQLNQERQAFFIETGFGKTPIKFLKIMTVINNLICNPEMKKTNPFGLKNMFEDNVGGSVFGNFLFISPGGLREQDLAEATNFFTRRFRDLIFVASNMQVLEANLLKLKERSMRTCTIVLISYTLHMSLFQNTLKTSKGRQSNSKKISKAETDPNRNGDAKKLFCNVFRRRGLNNKQEKLEWGPPTNAQVEVILAHPPKLDCLSKSHLPECEISLEQPHLFGFSNLKIKNNTIEKKSLKLWLEIVWRSICFDEATKIKNIKAMTTKAILNLVTIAQNNPFVRYSHFGLFIGIFTANPIVNNVGDLLLVMKLLVPYHALTKSVWWTGKNPRILSKTLESLENDDLEAFTEYLNDEQAKIFELNENSDLDDFYEYANQKELREWTDEKAEEILKVIKKRVLDPETLNKAKKQILEQVKRETIENFAKEKNYDHRAALLQFLQRHTVIFNSDTLKQYSLPPIKPELKETKRTVSLFATVEGMSPSDQSYIDQHMKIYMALMIWLRHQYNENKLTKLNGNSFDNGLLTMIMVLDLVTKHPGLLLTGGKYYTPSEIKNMLGGKYLKMSDSEIINEAASKDGSVRTKISELSQDKNLDSRSICVTNWMILAYLHQLKLFDPEKPKSGCFSLSEYIPNLARSILSDMAEELEECQNQKRPYKKIIYDSSVEFLQFLKLQAQAMQNNGKKVFDFAHTTTLHLSQIPAAARIQRLDDLYKSKKNSLVFCNSIIGMGFCLPGWRYSITPQINEAIYQQCISRCVRPSKSDDVLKTLNNEKQQVVFGFDYTVECTIQSWFRALCRKKSLFKHMILYPSVIDPNGNQINNPDFLDVKAFNTITREVQEFFDIWVCNKDSSFKLNNNDIIVKAVGEEASDAYVEFYKKFNELFNNLQEDSEDDEENESGENNLFKVMADYLKQIKPINFKSMNGIKANNLLLNFSNLEKEDVEEKTTGGPIKKNEMIEKALKSNASKTKTTQTKKKNCKKKILKNNNNNNRFKI